MDDFTRQCKQAVRDLRRMPAELRRELAHTVSADVATPLARQVKAHATRPYGQRVEVRVRKGAEPTLAVGGKRRVFSGGAGGVDVFYGAEFGGGKRPTTRQFVPARPFVFPTFAREFESVSEHWAAVLDPLLDAWAAGHG